MPRKNNKYLEFVRTLDCRVCGNPETVAHHAIGCGFGGMGMKAPDTFAMPLCHDHHAEIHHHGNDPRQYRFIVETQFKAIEAGIL